MNTGFALGIPELGNVSSGDLVVYAKNTIVSPAPFRITEFADGDGVNPESQEHAVTRIGIDGKPVYGIVFRMSQVTITLLPTSPFLELLDQWLGIAKKTKSGGAWSLEVTYPAIGKYAIFTEGTITNSPVLPPAQDTLGNIAIQFQFGHVDSQSIGIGDC